MRYAEDKFLQIFYATFALQEKIRAEFAKLDTDKSGYITKGMNTDGKLWFCNVNILDEMVTVISSEFQGDKVCSDVRTVAKTVARHKYYFQFYFCSNNIC